MISKEIASSSGKAIYIIPEDSDDLFTLRRIIKTGDIVVSDTTRVIKFEKEYSRPDRERVKIRVSVKVEKIGLDESIDRLRIAGTIMESNNSLVPKGTYHSVIVQMGNNIVVDKGKRWDDLDLKLLRSDIAGSFIIVAIDTKEAGIAKITGTHLEIIPNIYSGQSGKYYTHAAKNNPNIEVFFEEVYLSLNNILYEDGNYRLIVFGPGETKRRFYNFIMNKKSTFKNKSTVIDGVDVAGEDGIMVFLRSPSLKEVMGSSKISIVSNLLDQIMLQVNRGEEKYAMGFAEVSAAIKMKSIDSLVFSDSIFKDLKEEEIINLLNIAETYGANVYAVDSSTDIGLRVSALGGIIALLRYQIR
ncbi:MAG TPA: mRNA surveillance protein pelota [Nitrososphaeraceae archaeon]|jgi:protein pelota|nr:mRNA surveillance protein pelota [Nitrososphaeraceae archaeon]